MKTCKDCKHWRAEGDMGRATYDPIGKQGGYCFSTKLTEESPYELDALVYSFAEGGAFWTGPNFGCIHWSK